jgi:hypothetical protein
VIVDPDVHPDPDPPVIPSPEVEVEVEVEPDMEENGPENPGDPMENGLLRSSLVGPTRTEGHSSLGVVRGRGRSSPNR